MPRFGVLFLILATVLFCACPRTDNQEIDDQAGLMAPIERQRVVSFAHSLLRNQDIELKVVILERAAADLDQKALKLFEDYRVGNQTHGARGLLLVIDPLGH
ncbi:hypothetical protein A7E78_00460 [Syntrophotalea acetylenivorans]|uniref:TPM domain-containing protein n=1 Tax=Syntrophotalea acetylenivorans TaxID=1842532 RepID=A0A1L3GKN6_9BACT|nr:TPM domain-containing protein [Syntrophotalea acetylenivorans]APG26471.1 hypothetical protein A7E78_00460 [Syntrophotalea acetylenivorans]